MSLGAWINIKTLGVQHNVVSLGSAGGNRVSLYVSSGNVIQCWDNGNDLSSGVTISADTWYHVACTYDGTTKRIYVDGDEKDSAASTFGFTANNVVIGADITPTSFNTDGFIDDVFIYDRALSPEEVESTGSHYGVAWNGTDEFEGWAWGSDVLGWVAFNNKLGAGFAHGGAEHAVKFGGSTNAPTAVITCSQSPCETWLESTVLGNRLNPILTLINSSTDPEGDIITSTFTATDPAPLTQWASCAGTCNHTLQPVHPVSSYTVELRVEDSTGLSDTVVLGEEIKIRQGVIASFECSLDNSLYVDCSMIFPPANTVIYVKNTSTFSEIGTSIDGCDWTFEDANPASVSDPLCANVPVTFLSGGPKSVTLFATDDALKVGSTAETINTLLPFPEWKEVSPF
jgi:hypothetical protein